jgi:hypothetical protein
MRQDQSEAAIARSSYPAKMSRAVHSARAQIQGPLSPQRAGPRSRTMQQRALGPQST